MNKILPFFHNLCHSLTNSLLFIRLLPFNISTRILKINHIAFRHWYYLHQLNYYGLIGYFFFYSLMTRWRISNWKMSYHLCIELLAGRKLNQFTPWHPHKGKCMNQSECDHWYNLFLIEILKFSEALNVSLLIDVELSVIFQICGFHITDSFEVLWDSFEIFLRSTQLNVCWIYNPYFKGS